MTIPKHFMPAPRSDKQELSVLTKLCYNDTQGYVALMSILVIGAMGLYFALSLLLLGIGANRNSGTINDSERAKAAANACAEEALEQIRANTSFTGTGNLTLSTATCSYTVIAGWPGIVTVQATGTFNNITRRTKAVTNQLNPQILLTSWQEVTAF